jgi:N utilization substance protein B
VSGAGRRHRARELALRVLFEVEGTTKDADAALRYQADDVGAAPDVVAFGRGLVMGCLEHADAIDSVITSASEHWALADLGKVERAILRLGTYELIWGQDAPVAVVIDEAVELAKAYAGEEAAAFVNGVLGRVARQHV